MRSMFGSQLKQVWQIARQGKSLKYPTCGSNSGCRRESSLDRFSSSATSRKFTTILLRPHLITPFVLSIASQDDLFRLQHFPIRVEWCPSMSGRKFEKFSKAG